MRLPDLRRQGLTLQSPPGLRDRRCEMPTIWGDKVTTGPINTATPVVFNVPVDYPSGAIVWKMDGIAGWNETPDIDMSLEPIGGGVDGEIVPEIASDRALHLLATGYVIAEDRASAETLVDVIMRDAFPRNRDLILRRDETVPKYVTCRVSSKREIIPGDKHEFRWVVPLVAGDPRKYDADPPGSSTGTAGVSGQSTTGFTFPLVFPLEFTQIESGSTIQSSLTV